MAEAGDEEGGEGLQMEGEGRGEVAEEGEESVVQGEGEDPAFRVLVVGPTERGRGRREGGGG